MELGKYNRGRSIFMRDRGEAGFAGAAGRAGRSEQAKGRRRGTGTCAARGGPRREGRGRRRVLLGGPAPPPRPGRSAPPPGRPPRGDAAPGRRPRDGGATSFPAPAPLERSSPRLRPPPPAPHCTALAGSRGSGRTPARRARDCLLLSHPSHSLGFQRPQLHLNFGTLPSP